MPLIVAQEVSTISYKDGFCLRVSIKGLTPSFKKKKSPVVVRWCSEWGVFVSPQGSNSNTLTIIKLFLHILINQCRTLHRSLPHPPLNAGKTHISLERKKIWILDQNPRRIQYRTATLNWHASHIYIIKQDGFLLKCLFIQTEHPLQPFDHTSY